MNLLFTSSGGMHAQKLFYLIKKKLFIKTLKFMLSIVILYTLKIKKFFMIVLLKSRNQRIKTF